MIVIKAGGKCTTPKKKTLNKNRSTEKHFKQLVDLILVLVLN